MLWMCLTPIARSTRMPGIKRNVANTNTLTRNESHSVTVNPNTAEVFAHGIRPAVRYAGQACGLLPHSKNMSAKGARKPIIAVQYKTYEHVDHHTGP